MHWLCQTHQNLGGCLRFNDVQGVRPDRIHFSLEGLRAVLERSKTTGPGKRVGELFIFIARAACFSGVDWMAAGMELLRGEELSFDRDYLIPLMRYEEGGHIGVRKKIAPYSAAAGYGRAVLRQLHDVRLGLEAWEETDASMFSIE